jgi:hypothetical protein
VRQPTHDSTSKPSRKAAVNRAEDYLLEYRNQQSGIYKQASTRDFEALIRQLKVGQGGIPPREGSLFDGTTETSVTRNRCLTTTTAPNAGCSCHGR